VTAVPYRGGGGEAGASRRVVRDGRLGGWGGGDVGGGGAGRAVGVRTEQRRGSGASGERSPTSRSSRCSPRAASEARGFSTPPERARGAGRRCGWNFSETGGGRWKSSDSGARRGGGPRGLAAAGARRRGRAGRREKRGRGWRDSDLSGACASRLRWPDPGRGGDRRYLVQYWQKWTSHSHRDLTALCRANNLYLKEQLDRWALDRTEPTQAGE
jgi:hypothetical protein